ncbi:MAG: RNA polymerase sigma factor [Gemmatimonadetes bacterium]|nr:RNA polymerase sigma factor [Gemmatimonadota bacterium]
MTETASDQELIRRIGGGDRDAFATLIQRHEASLYRYLMSLASTPTDAEDALQECFLSLWRRPPERLSSVSARGWLLTVSRNALRKLYRRRVGEPESFEDVDALGEERLGALGLNAGWGGRSGVDPEELERRDLLEKALERLSPLEREVLILRDLEGFSGTETTGLLEISPQAMKSRLHRARLRLMSAVLEMSDG